MSISHEELIARIEYDQESGQMMHLRSSHGMPIGSMVGTNCPNGYRATKIQGKRYYLHRLAWFYVHGEWPKGQIDHINGVRDDNRIANLRDVSPSVNLQNTHRVRRNNKSGLVGAQTKGKYFCSRIVLNGKSVHLGYFPTAQAASEAFIAAKAARAARSKS